MGLVIYDPTRSAFDLTLQDTASSPTTTVQLTLAPDENGNKRITERRIEAQPPRVSEGPFNYSHTDPLVDLVWSQNDWSEGCGEVYYTPGSKKYMAGSSVDARWPGVIACWTQNQAALDNFLIQNPRAAGGNSTGWTAGTGVTVTTGQGVGPGSAPAGVLLAQRFDDLTDTSRSANDILQYTELANPTVYRSREITVIAYIVRVSGSEAGARLFVDDGVSAVSRSSAITSATFSYVSVTKTIDAAGTRVRIGIDVSANITSAHRFQATAFYGIPTGGVQCVGTTVLKQSGANEWYAAIGRVCTKYDRTNNKFDAVYIHASAAITDIEAFQTNVFLAFGGTAQYVYGSDTTWTASGTSGNKEQAKYWAVGRNSTGAMALFQGQDVSSTNKSVILSTTTPTTVASWSGTIEVGDTDRAITGMYAFNDSVVVGKEEGLFYYNRYVDNTATSANQFKNLLPCFETQPHTDNFTRGVMWQGSLYMLTYRGEVVRFNGEVVEFMGTMGGSLASGLSGFWNTTWQEKPTGVIKALATDPSNLWLVGDNQGAATTNRAFHLYSLRLVDDKPILHNHYIGLSTGQAQDAQAAIDWAFVGNGTLHLMHRFYDASLAGYISRPILFQLPTSSRAPYLEPSPIVDTVNTNSLYTSLWDAGMPGELKAYRFLEIWTVGTDANNTVTVTVRIDGSTSTSVSQIISTSSSVPVRTVVPLTQSAATTGRVLQLQITLYPQSGTSGPRVLAFTVHAVLRPARIKQWEAVVDVGHPVLRNGQPDPQARITLLTNLSTLETQAYPITMIEDFDEDGVTASRTVLIRSLERVIDSSVPGEELYRLVLQEVPTS